MANVNPMAAERGERIQDRLNGLRMSHRAFEEATGINRVTVRRAVNGEEAVRENTYGQIETWLDRLEAEQLDRLEEHDAVRTRAARALKERRLSAGMTVVQLAELAGVDRNTLTAIEGGSGFRDTTMRKIEAVLERAEQEHLSPEPEDDDRLDITITVSIKGADLRRILGIGSHVSEEVK